MTKIQKLAKKLKTPRQVQTYLRKLRYNSEEKGITLFSAEQAARRGSFHCYEAAFVAAAILEHHDYPPLVMSLESKDGLDHVLYVFQKNGLWGAIGKSRCTGLGGRPAMYKSLRDLAWSYFDPYVDNTGRVTAYQIAHLDETQSDWRGSSKNVWKAEEYLLELKHKPLKSSKKRYQKLLKDYRQYGDIPRRPHWW